jgi:hypothetical protein
MQIITFSDSGFNRLRAQLHEIPYQANNALIERLKFSVGPAVAKKVHDVLNELPNRKEVSITDRLDTAQLKEGDIVRIILRPNTAPQLAALTLSVRHKTWSLAALTLSVTHKTWSQSNVVSAHIFSQNQVNDPLTSQSSARLPHTLISKSDRFWGKKSITPLVNKIGKFEILSSEIQAMTVHRTPAIQGIINKFKRGYNIFLDLFKAETKISKTKQE